MLHCKEHWFIRRSKINKPDSGEKPEDEIKHPDGLSIFIGIVLIVVAVLLFFGWYHVGLLFLKIVLYIVGSIIASFGTFSIVEEFTPHSDHVYSLDAMSLTICASLLYASFSMDISAVKWIFRTVAGILLFFALVQSIEQLNKDIKSRQTFAWVTEFLLIFGLFVILSWHFEMPQILLFFPVAAIALDRLYLRSSFLKPTNSQMEEINNEADVNTGAIGTDIRGRINFEPALRNLAGIFWSLNIVLVLFFGIFYFIIMNVPSEDMPFSFLYGVVAPAYLGILAIVIAFAVLVADKKEKPLAHIKTGVMGLVQMYVLFSLATLVGLLFGTKIDPSILVGKHELGAYIGQVSGLINICRILAVEFTVLAFPVGIVYLYALIKDFMVPTSHSDTTPTKKA